VRDAVIVEAVRTAVGKRNGALSALHPADLSAIVLDALAERSRIDPAVVDDVVWGCVSQIGEQAFNIGRNAVLSAGWPESVPGTTVDRQCGSSQQALHFAAAGVVSGQYDVAVAGGVELMSRIPMGSSANGQSPLGERYAARYGEGAYPSQGLGAEEIARRWKLSRRDLDEFALASHEKAAAAIDAGAFAAQIVPVHVNGDAFDTDQGVRRGGTLESLGALKPAFLDDGVLHAGNSSQISDGAAALLVTTSERAAQLGLTPIARVHTAVLAGDDPNVMLTAPIPATRKALAVSGLSIDDIGAFEVNEAFASVPRAWQIELGVDGERVNPLGGAIALGHPLGGSGARITTTLVHHMRERGVRYGLQTMCEGGGLSNATIFELVS
jgi:acetyl-CoA acyltransferase